MKNRILMGLLCVAAYAQAAERSLAFSAQGKGVRVQGPSLYDLQQAVESAEDARSAQEKATETELGKVERVYKEKLSSQEEISEEIDALRVQVGRWSGSVSLPIDDYSDSLKTTDTKKVLFELCYGSALRAIIKTISLTKENIPVAELFQVLEEEVATKKKNARASYEENMQRINEAQRFADLECCTALVIAQRRLDNEALKIKEYERQQEAKEIVDSQFERAQQADREERREREEQERDRRLSKAMNTVEEAEAEKTFASLEEELKRQNLHCARPLSLTGMDLWRHLVGPCGSVLTYGRDQRNVEAFFKELFVDKESILVGELVEALEKRKKRSL